ncbi:MAG: discoidin domain-containing protein [Prevotellaceae bacterium]|nr:discoidin domain-containing protein [Prevotellaceae bacterium]
MKKVIYLIIIAFAAGYFFSCKGMDDVYEEFLVPNGLKYPQRPYVLEAHAGYNRLQLTWLKAIDPGIVSARIYWNNYLDSLILEPIPDSDTISVDIPVADENTYTFYVKTFDADGNASIPSEVSGAAYGDNYALGTTDRTIASAIRDDSHNGTITWNSKTTDLAYSEVRYTSSSGETKIVRILPDESTLNCPDTKFGTVIEYRSVFLPPRGIDYVEKDWITYELPFSYKYPYPRTDWTAEAKGGNHPWDDAGGGQPALVFDGDLATGWHSHTGSDLPQCLVVDMKQSLPVHHITISPPTNASWTYLDDIEIYFSNTPINPDVSQPSLWGEAIVKMKYPGPNGSSFTVNFPSIPSTQFVVLYFTSSQVGPYISIMEFEVFGL